MCLDRWVRWWLVDFDGSVDQSDHIAHCCVRGGVGTRASRHHTQRNRNHNAPSMAARRSARQRPSSHGVSTPPPPPPSSSCWSTAASSSIPIPTRSLARFCSWTCKGVVLCQLEPNMTAIAGTAIPATATQQGCRSIRRACVWMAHPMLWVGRAGRALASDAFDRRNYSTGSRGKRAEYEHARPNAKRAKAPKPIAALSGRVCAAFFFFFITSRSIDPGLARPPHGSLAFPHPNSSFMVQTRTRVVTNASRLVTSQIAPHPPLAFPLFPIPDMTQIDSFFLPQIPTPASFPMTVERYEQKRMRSTGLLRSSEAAAVVVEHRDRGAATVNVVVVVPHLGERVGELPLVRREAPVVLEIGEAGLGGPDDVFELWKKRWGLCGKYMCVNVREEGGNVERKGS